MVDYLKVLKFIDVLVVKQNVAVSKYDALISKGAEQSSVDYLLEGELNLEAMEFQKKHYDDLTNTEFRVLFIRELKKAGAKENGNTLLCKVYSNMLTLNENESFPENE